MESLRLVKKGCYNRPFSGQGLSDQNQAVIQQAAQMFRRRKQRYPFALSLRFRREMIRLYLIKRFMVLETITVINWAVPGGVTACAPS